MQNPIRIRKWITDRGTEPQRRKTPDSPGNAKFDDCLWHDLHYRNETKQAARAAHEHKGSEA